MKYIKLFSLFYLCLLVGPFAGAQVESENVTARPVALSEELKRAYDSGEPLILYAYREEAVSSEAYADWASYLNEFKQAEGKGYGYSKVVADEFAVIPSEATEFTLFLKKGHPVLFYEGFIVEPQVYTAIHRKFSDKPLTDLDRAFMPEELR